MANKTELGKKLSELKSICDRLGGADDAALRARFRELLDGLGDTLGDESAKAKALGTPAQREKAKATLPPMAGHEKAVTPDVKQAGALLVKLLDELKSNTGPMAGTRFRQIIDEIEALAALVGDGLLVSAPGKGYVPISDRMPAPTKAVHPDIIKAVSTKITALVPNSNEREQVLAVLIAERRG